MAARPKEDDKDRQEARQKDEAARAKALAEADELIDERLAAGGTKEDRRLAAFLYDKKERKRDEDKSAREYAKFIKAFSDCQQINDQVKNDIDRFIPDNKTLRKLRRQLQL